MIKKIISGGQTGADRAALDVAMELGIPHGGWLPRGRKTENGRLSDIYILKEASSISYPLRTELNVIDSDGTLIISHGMLSGGSAFTQEMAKKHRRSCLHMDLSELNEYKVVEIINSWIEVKEIHILNVAGPRASEEPQIYEAVKTILKSVLYPPPDKMATSLPQTVEEAVHLLLSLLSLQEKTNLANMGKDELFNLDRSLGNYIREKFRLGSDNFQLMESCRSASGEENRDEENTSIVIITGLWKKLQKTHALRIV